MAVLNKDVEFDIRSDIFQFINDRDKTKFFIDEVIDRLRILCDVNWFRLHVFYNVKTKRFTINEKFGETMFVAYLPLTRYKFSILDCDGSVNKVSIRILIKEDKLELLYKQLHEKFVSRVRANKDDLLKIYFLDKYSDDAIGSYLLQKHDIDFFYQLNGWILPEYIQHNLWKEAFNVFYKNGLNLIEDLNSNEFKQEAKKYIYEKLFFSREFMIFRKSWVNEIEHFLLKNTFNLETVGDEISRIFGLHNDGLINLLNEIYKTNPKAYSKIAKKITPELSISTQE